MSAEKVAVLRALKAEIIRTPTQAAYDSPESHIGVARRLEKEIPNAHILDQYGNPDNPLAHELGTAEEIWRQTEGKVTAVVAGAGTGGTITGISRGLKKHNKDIKIIAGDPQGSILAVPASLNEEFANQPYKVEGIGYDFIPDVLKQDEVDHWYKTDDRESFMYARRLISEEGLLIGGSSGSAMAATVKAIKDLGLGKDDVVVVVFSDSIRSYLSKFVDDDYLAANDLLPESAPITPPPEPEHNDGHALQAVASEKSSSKDKDGFQGATIRTLRLKPVTTVLASTPCEEAIEMMRDKGFDQLPVKAALNSSRLVGLVTLGNLLSYLGSGRANATSPVSEVMFNFSKISEVVTDPRDVSRKTKIAAKAEEKKGNDRESKRNDFVEITMDTPLSALSRFFEWNSAAVVTEKENGEMKPVAVVTKVDLLSWLVRQKKA